jgi:hypothetical protein
MSEVDNILEAVRTVKGFVFRDKFCGLLYRAQQSIADVTTAEIKIPHRHKRCSFAEHNLLGNVSCDPSCGTLRYGDDVGG